MVVNNGGVLFCIVELELNDDGGDPRNFVSHFFCCPGLDSVLAGEGIKMIDCVYPTLPCLGNTHSYVQ